MRKRGTPQFLLDINYLTMGFCGHSTPLNPVGFLSITEQIVELLFHQLVQSIV